MSKILVIDDEKSIRNALKEILEYEKFSVDLAENGVEGLEKFNSDDYDIVLCDIKMPEMDGNDATRRIRSHGYRGPIIALTARVMLGDRENCLDAGCDDYVAKPIDVDVLLGVIARHLNQEAEPTRPRSSSQREEESNPAPKPTGGSKGLLDNPAISDADRARLWDKYILALAARADEIEGAFERRDRQQLMQLAHSIHGTAPLYGFNGLSQAALSVECDARGSASIEELESTIMELVDGCRQIAKTPSEAMRNTR